MVEKSMKMTRPQFALGGIAICVLLAACSSAIDLGGSIEVDAESDSGSTAEAEEGQGEAVDNSEIASEISPDGDGLLINIGQITDGDSVRASSEEGELEIRLIGINAPERDECFGTEAGERLEALLDGAEVTLHPWPAELDDFGRELGFVVADGVFVNLALVESGHVLARNQSDHQFVAEFDDAEERASADSRGLWADDACGEPVEGDLVIVEVFENAPGDDRENPNGEFVILENVGESAVTMTDWGLRDESTRHRYTFPEVEVEPGEFVQIRTGCGNNDLGSDPIELFWCDPEPPVWNNGGDLALLLDPNGAIVSEFVVVGS